MHPLRIEMVLPSLQLGGMEMMVIHLARLLAERGHRLGITCTESRGDAAVQAEAAGLGVTLVRTPGLRTNVRAPALEAHFRNQAADVVHSHSGVWLKAAHAAHRASVSRVIHTVHGLLDHEPWHGRLLKRLAARYTDVTVAVSAPLHEYLSGACKLPPNSITTIINGVDSSRFAPLPADSDVRKARRDRFAGDWAPYPLVAHVARLVPVKNQLVLLEAFHRTLARIPEARLIVAGDGPLRPALEAHASRLGISSHIRWLGPVSDVREWLPAMDAFILSSDAEGTSISILEALACGVPVVGTAVGGTPRLLKDGATGLIVPPGDPAALGESLVRLLSDAELRVRLASAGRRKVDRDFNVQSMVARYEQLYRGVGEGNSTPGMSNAQCVA